MFLWLNITVLIIAQDAGEPLVPVGSESLQKESDSKNQRIIKEPMSVENEDPDPVRLPPPGIPENSVLLNGSFEQEGSESNSSWLMVSGNPPTRSSEESHTGRYSVHSRLQNQGPQPSEGHLIQIIDTGIVGGKTYDFSFWIKEVQFGVSYVQEYSLDWIDINGDRLKEKGLTQFRTGSDNWQEIKVEDLVAPPEAEGARVFFRFVTGAVKGGAGEVYIDDISLSSETQIPPAPAPQSQPVLLWKNGDALPGEFLASGKNRVRWSSPLFKDAMDLDVNVIDSILFPRSPGQTTGAFRVGTVMGDVFTADLIGSDEFSMFLSSPRHGEIRINRDSIYSFNRISNPNLSFEGSQFSDWGLEIDGILKDLNYKVYKNQWGWAQAEFPDLSSMDSVQEGRFPAGYLDLSLSKVRGSFFMAFDGRIEISHPGEHEFYLWADDQARLFIDGKRIVQFLKNGRGNPLNGGHSGWRFLEAGSHLVRLEYLELGGAYRLVASMTGPDSITKSLVGSNEGSAWQQGPGGHPVTDREKSILFKAIEVPEQFEMELEVTSSGSPRFVLALGKSRSLAQTDESLRLETWGNELVVVQDTVFEPILTIRENQRDVRIRLVYNGREKELEILNSAGRSLVKVKEVLAATGESGIYVRNRGKDLTIRRLSVYHKSGEINRQAVYASKARVHLNDGRVMYGLLNVKEGQAFVLDEEGMRRDLDLKNIDRISRPDVSLRVRSKAAILTFEDGEVLRGELNGIKDDQIEIQTYFSETPVRSVLSGASWLRFGSGIENRESTLRDSDQLFSSSGYLRGELVYDLEKSPVGWRPAGSENPLRISNSEGFRVERRFEKLPDRLPFNSQEYPSLIHLTNGEIIPCRVRSCSEKDIGIQSPFLRQGYIESIYLKAIEFVPSNRPPTKNASSEIDDWLTDLLGPYPTRASRVDPRKLNRALTVPRVNRDSPPSHILVARNGDLKRGKLLAFDGENVQFESKLRKMSVSVDLLAKVVNVTGNEVEAEEAHGNGKAFERSIRAVLSDGSVFVFEPLEFIDGKLIGTSPIYGEVSIPTEAIKEITLGNFENDRFEYLFESWKVKPAREPGYTRKP